MAESARRSVNDRAVIRRRHPWRDAIEGILSAVILVLIIRHFTFEVFKIPTGSMATTLLGQHIDARCPNCGLSFPMDGGNEHVAAVATGSIVERCPNCGYAFGAPWNGPEARRELDEMLRRRCTCFPPALSAPSGRFSLFGAGGNRVIVNKFLRLVRAPERWDVTVFWYPYGDVHCFRCGLTKTRVFLDGRSVECPDCHSHLVWVTRLAYIKRLVGLPNEQLEVRHGDLYANGRLQRKPAAVQEAEWRLVYDSRYVPKKPQPGFSPRWRGQSGAYTDEAGVLRLTPGADGEAMVQYAPAITDYASYNGVRPGEDFVPVGDLRWDTQVRLDGPGQLRLDLDRDGVIYSARVAVGAGKTRLRGGDEPMGESDFRLQPGGVHRVIFSNVDRRLELKVDGQVVLAKEYDAPESERPRSSGAALAVERTSATFERVRLHRDIYYFWNRDINLGTDQYFMFGDNVRNSADSRMWGYVPAANLIGRAMVVWWPLNHIRPVR